MPAMPGRPVARHLVAAAAAAALLLAGCSGGIGTAGTPVPSGNPCQPVGDTTPAPPPASPAAVSQSDAEAIGIALFRACSGPPALVKDVTVSTRAASGMRLGPNAGQPVWLVQIQARVTINASPYAFYTSAFLIEVNAATGAATVIGQG